MFKKTIIIIFIIIFLQPYAYGKDRLKIVTSIAPLAYFIENIGGDRVDVTTLIPPGGNPHTYEPTLRQMNTLSNADLYVKAGSGIEFEIIWMKKMEDLNKNMSLCDASEGISLIETDGHEADNEHGEKGEHEDEHHHHGRRDPHIWLSPVNAVIIAENIKDSLSGADPENSEYYHKNASLLIDKLESLKNNITAMLGEISNRKFFTFHPAWGYFAEDFNLEQIPVELSGKEPTPERLGRLIKKAREENVKVIFSSPQFSKKSAEVIAREINGKVVFIDPMSEDYINNLEYTAQLLQENMR